LYNVQTNAQLISTLLYCSILHCSYVLHVAFKYLCNLAGTDYELPEDDAIVSKCVGAV